MKNLSAAILFIILGILGARAQYVSQVWSPDQGDGTYVNPVLYADYSDPDVCACDSGFWLTASSFEASPALPILFSTDLVNWRIAGHALPRLEPDSFDRPQHGRGVWAPSLRHHSGTFYIYWGDPDQGIFMIKTTNPAGSWSRPLLVKAGKGLIDPCPLWDDDGRCYLVHGWAASRAHINSLLTLCELNSEGTAPIGNEVMIYDGNVDNNHTCEGPKLYKRNGYYYILCPAGGVAQGWQLALRSKNIYGPYEARRVMEQGKSSVNGPHQGGWVETQGGASWFLHFQDLGLYGRVVHLQPMSWKDDWPVIGNDPDGNGCGNPVSRYKKPYTGRPSRIENPVESDDFNSLWPGPQWQWSANYQESYGMGTPYGYLRLFTRCPRREGDNLWEAPNLLLQKFPAPAFTFTAQVKLTVKEELQEGGIVIMGRDYCTLTLEREGDNFVLLQRVCIHADEGGGEATTLLARFEPDERQPIEYAPTTSKNIFLRTVIKEGGLCTFFYSIDGKRFIACGSSFTAREGKWTGAKIGLLCREPYAVPEPNRGWMDVEQVWVTNNS